MSQMIMLFTSSLLLVLALPSGEFSVSSFEDFKKILPIQIVETYQNLNPQEKEALLEVFRNYRKYHNEQEFIDTLKQKSPSLGARAEKLFGELQENVSRLSEEPRVFIENLLKTSKELFVEHLNGSQIDRTQLKQIAMGVMSHYRSMPSYAQDELKETFPEVVQLLGQARVQGIKGMVQRLLNRRGDR